MRRGRGDQSGIKAPQVMKAYVTILLLLIYASDFFPLAASIFPGLDPVVDHICYALWIVSASCLVILSGSMPYIWNRSRTLGVVAALGMFLFLLLNLVAPRLI